MSIVSIKVDGKVIDSIDFKSVEVGKSSNVEAMISTSSDFEIKNIKYLNDDEDVMINGPDTITKGTEYPVIFTFSPKTVRRTPLKGTFRIEFEEHIRR